MSFNDDHDLYPNDIFMEMSEVIQKNMGTFEENV